MVSKARLDLPDPDRPVNTISLSRGSSTLTFFRLCSRAPRTLMVGPLGTAVLRGAIPSEATEAGAERRPRFGGFGSRSRSRPTPYHPIEQVYDDHVHEDWGRHASRRARPERRGRRPAHLGPAPTACPGAGRAARRSSGGTPLGRRAAGPASAATA